MVESSGRTGGEELGEQGCGERSWVVVETVQGWLRQMGGVVGMVETSGRWKGDTCDCGRREGGANLKG